MTKRLFVVAALAMALAISAPVAMAGSLCPNTADVTGGINSTYSSGSNCTETMSIPDPQDYARLMWASGSTGYPADLTLGNLEGITSSVALTAGTDQPYYMLVFTDPNDSFLSTISGDQILMLEFQDSTLSGPGNDTLALDPNSTLFNLYDNTLGKYLESGQQDTNTLAEWIALDSNLSSDDIQQIRLAIGLSGGSGPAESLTVNSVDVTATPEPSSLLLLGTGLLGMGFLLRKKAMKARPVSSF